MKTAIIIPARLAATRLPGKPLALLGGLPMVVRVARQARRCAAADQVVIATDAPAIYDAARQHDVAAVMTATHHVSGSDRVAEAAAILGAQYVINVQGDEPFIDPRDLDAIAHALVHSQAPIVTLKRPLEGDAAWHNPNVVKVVTRDDGRALYFSRASIPHRRGSADAAAPYAAPLAFQHVGVYGFRSEVLVAMCRNKPHPLETCEGLEQLRALAMGFDIAVLPAHTDARGIDTEDDLAWAQSRIQRLGEAAFPPGTTESRE